MIIPLVFPFAAGKTVSVRITDVTDPSVPSIIRAYSSTGVIEVPVDLVDSKYYLSYNFPDDGLYQVDAYDNDGNQSPGIVIDRTVGGILRLGDITALALEASVQAIPTVKFQDGKVYCDTSLTAPGTTYPLGEITSPVDNIEDAKTIAYANNLHIIHYVNDDGDPHTVDYGSFLIEGVEGDGGYTTIYPGTGSILEFARFRKCYIESEFLTAADYIVADDCYIADLNSGQYLFTRCHIGQSRIITPTAGSFLDSCFSIAGPDYPCVIDLANLPEGASLVIDKWRGFITIKNMVAPCGVWITAESGVVTIDASCIAGEITIYGNCTVVDNGNGVTVNDYTGISGGSAPYVIQIDTVVSEYDENTKEIKIYTGTAPDIEFIVTRNGIAVDLTGQTVYLVAKKDERTPLAKAVINKLGTVHDTNQVRFSLSFAETTALTLGTFKGQIDIGPGESVTNKFTVIIEKRLRE
jgi:hypothetical protein